MREIRNLDFGESQLQCAQRALHLGIWDTSEFLGNNAGGITFMSRRRQRVRRGVAAVEAAVILPLVVLIVFGSIELGWYLRSAQALQEAARRGARAAVDLDNSNAEVQAEVLQSLDETTDVDPTAVTVRLSRVDANGNEIYQIQSLDQNEQGLAVRVTVSVDYSELGFMVNILGLRGRRLECHSTMRRRPI